MNRKWMAIVTLLVLMLSVCVFALAEQTDGAPTATPGLGLITPKPAGTPKPTKTPKPTASPEPVPTFTPGILEKHEGHDVRIIELEKLEYTHRVREYCNDCKVTIRTYWEDHQLDAEGHCTKCSYRCKHDRTYVLEVPADGGEKTWDGNWISYPGTEITVCYRCNKYLKYENTIIRKFHNRHTRFLPEQECLPHDADTHALVRICEDCGTEVSEYVPHNCPSSDRPYTDDGDPDTHSRLVRCDDCGFWVPQQQAHTWVHDSYKKDETDGGEEGHIEVMKCTVCGAKKAVWRPHGAGTPVAYRQNGNADTHIVVLRCTLCNETFEAERPHEMEHASCRNDGDVNTHIEVLKCTQCEAEAERREVHKPKHIIWKSISDTQDQETVRCNMCGLTYTCAPAAHAFNTYTYVSDGEGSSAHTKYAACSKCGMRKSTGVKEAHTWHWGRHYWNYCDKCNEADGHNHLTGGSMSARGFRPVDENNHIAIWGCTYCAADYKGGISAHTFDPVTMKCTDCGYLKEGCEHHYSYKQAGTGIQEEHHTLIGTCSRCGKQITETEAHDMQFASVTEFKPYGDCHIRTVTERCSACGYEKQHTEKKAHDMQFVSADEYASSGDLQHTYTVTERCSVCGNEAQHTETENHSFSSGESLGAQEHKPICALCGGYGIPEPHLFVCTSDESAHVCSVCGEKGEHDYFFVEYRCDGAWIYHTCVYQCQGCMHEKKGESQEHPLETLYEPIDDARHRETIWCPLCGISATMCCMHVFDESETCACGYQRGDQADGVLWPQAGQTEDTGDGTTVTPVFCHLTADGNEMFFGYVSTLSDEVVSENGNAFNFIILPESISGDAVIEIRFTAPELELLQSLGIKSVYIRLGENDLLLPGDIWQISEALFGQDTGELLITLTPGSDGAYTVQYDPAGVYITE